MAKYKFIFRIILTLMLIVISVNIVSCTYNIEEETPYIIIADKQISLDIVELDLSNSNIGDISSIPQLQQLKKLNLRGNNIIPQDIVFLQEALPECDIAWSVKIGNTLVDNTIEEMDLFNLDYGDVSQLIMGLNYLPNIKRINLTDSVMTTNDYKELSEEFPNIIIKLEIDLFGMKLDSKETFIDVSEILNIDEDVLINKLNYFSDLSVVDFGAQTLSKSLMDSLTSTFPSVCFVWNIDLCDRAISSNDTEIVLSEYIIDDYITFKNSLKYLTKLKYIEMCDCGLDDNQMEDLIYTYPDKKFVWKIYCGGWELRTDIKAFSTGNRRASDYQLYEGGYGYLKNDDAAKLAYCTDLIALDVGHQIPLTDFSFLEKLPNLRYLIVAMTGIEDLSSFEGLENLEYLEVFSTKVSDFSPLQDLPNLYHLNISLTKIQNIDALKQMKQLQNLWFSLRDLTQEQIDELRNELPNCRIVNCAGDPTSRGWRSEDNQTYIEMMDIFGMKPIFSN